MIVLLLPILVSSAWAVQLPVGSDGGANSDGMDKVRSGCEYPFEPVGNGCFFFSEDTRNFEGAQRACENLGGYHVNLATFDMDENQDAALLVAAASKDKTFWVGGRTEDGENWEWVDGRPMYLQAPILYYNEPNEAQNKCMVAQVTVSGKHKRSLLYDFSCDESLNFICQIGCPIEFRPIGPYCYFISEEEGVSHLTWDESRDFCEELSVPVGYHADLAVLGLDDQDTYRLMNNLVAGYEYSNTWLGGLEQSDCVFKWVDGRDLPTSSPLWRYNEPDCGTEDLVFMKQDSLNRTYLYDYPHNGAMMPFICQMFRD